MSAAPSPSAGTSQPRRSALKGDTDSERTPPLSASVKAVQIAAPEPPSSADEAQTRKQFPATIARRLSGRPAIQTSSSRTSLFSLGSVDGGTGESGAGASSSSLTEEAQQSQHRHRAERVSEKLLAQVADWLEREKNKKEKKKTHRFTRQKSPPVEKAAEPIPGPAVEPGRARAPSVGSNSSEVSLDRLQRILDDSMAVLGLTSIPHLGPHLGRKHHKKSHKRPPSLSRTVSSDTEFFEGDVVVPSCDAVLDNSKTLSYVGGKAVADDAASISSRREEKEKQAWITFKNEIIRLAHTLALKGWRRVPLDSGEAISVERLSGALTNAVYVVSPPPESVLPPVEGKKQPTKVLLRIYGPQVEHLIDRETELSVLRRLARKKIGPRLLGTFLNGRFEQFFNAATLTPANLREPETSKQIAKRMRELHDGVDLLEEERDQGPAVWKNWDKWLSQAERTVQYVDQQILSGNPGVPRGPGSAWKGRGLICGVEWPVFKAMVEKYRKFLDDHYGNPKEIRQKLVFAHNDTQYGNILRIRPDDEKSPLLVPANEHKQLVVIDFEYAAANLPGYELANHFSEWTYNYHDPIAPYACDTSKYPTLEQQHRFIRAYVDHKPKFSASDASTPKMTPTETPALHSARSASSIVEFTLDARSPPGGWKEQESKNEDATEKRIKELMDETRLWRIANSAQWVSWGIIQAKIPGLVLSPEDGTAEGAAAAAAEEDGVDPDVDPDAFDYLGYAQQRALFFWGDCVLMGLVKLDELPEEVREKVKLVHY
ncbi:kinase-like domain-containing protein [Lasiosphaeris hirsuta]|uniref:Kinase-like domain-containing protein n=1 Tax=Lasiosphaeris hirsuta TaxID=260670 RepID=A0AA40E7M1_9PEZI|nr:kinase-like domain-containing protein [Lasiosphaeris hirsuta]